MKVRCIRLLDSMGKPQDESGWLTIGKIYPVLEVIQDQDRWLLRLMGDGLNGPALFQSEQFEIVTPSIPSSWSIGWGSDGFLELSPGPWKQVEFWANYYDGNPDAIKIFEEEKKKILDADI